MGFIEKWWLDVIGLLAGFGILLAWSLNAQTIPSPAADTNDYPTVTLAWNRMTNPIVAGIRVYFGGASGTYTNKTDCGTNTTLDLYDLPSGAAYYFAATSYSAQGAESAMSAEVSWTNYAYTVTNQIFQLWSGTNRLLNISNPTWSLMFFDMSNGVVRARGQVSGHKATNWNAVASFDRLTNFSGKLAATNLIQYKRTP